MTNLHDGVCTRLGITAHGVGVIAILDIPKDTYLFPQDGSDSYGPEFSIDMKEVESLPPPIQRMYRDFCVVEDGKYVSYEGFSFNKLTPSWFLNHSKDPNAYRDLNYDSVAARDIKAGEEITADYTTYSFGEEDFSTEVWP